MNSRAQKRHDQVWRRRQCQACQAVFTTHEIPDYSLAWLVRQGTRTEPFSRDKLFLSLYYSVGHRKSPVADAGGLTRTVIDKLRLQISGGSVSAATITHVAQVALNRFDQAASVHYSARH